MDGPSFDILGRIARAASTRRAALTSALIPAAAGLGVAAFGGGNTIEAKKKKKKKCKCKAKSLGESCTSNKQCCTNETNRLCAIPSNPSSSQTVCCGGVGAKCTGIDDCCGDFTCDNGVCDS
jgi:hypothetical protein